MIVFMIVQVVLECLFLYFSFLESEREKYAKQPNDQH
jgi:hypothetical protein